MVGEILANQAGKLRTGRQLRELAGRKSFGRRESTYAEYKAEVQQARKSVGVNLNQRASALADDMEKDMAQTAAQPMPNSWKDQMDRSLERIPTGTEERSLTPVEEAPFKAPFNAPINAKLEVQKAEDDKKVSRHRLTSALALVEKDVNSFRDITVNVCMK